jgi:hypothetical protein
LLNLDEKHGVFINTFKFENDKVIEIETLKKEKFEKYFDFWKYLNDFEKRDYICNLGEALKFKLPKKAIETFGEGFCFRYFRDLDDKFLYHDKYAKHFILDFDAIENNKEKFFKQPDIFPFYIGYLNVMITKDYKILKNNMQISPDRVFELEKDFNKSLIPIIQKKDKIYKAMQKDIFKKYFKLKEFLNTMKICDKNIEIVITFFDIGGNEIYFNICNENTLKNSIYDLKIENSNIKINRILWGLIDKFGIRIATAKLNMWCEIKTDLQMFYKI